jgi:hypothetical protein
MTAEVLFNPETGGQRQIHLTLFAPGVGAVDVESAALTLAAPDAGIEAIPQEMVHTGIGHFIGSTDDLRLATTWVVGVSVRVDRFTETSGTAEVDVTSSG